VIFRATKQWFISVEHKELRKRLLEHIDRVEWYPSWGKPRITAMVQERPDWCISRQKVWGVPIPALYCEGCGEVLLTRDSVLGVKEAVAREGSGVWFEKDAGELLPEGAACSKCGGKSFRKETDIFDVWFEAGSSHRAVLRNPRNELAFPADLYLEGHDQHRGWFQLSLIPSVAAEDVSPYKAVVTHGHLLDENGNKMSKSLGNLVSVGDALSVVGADMQRLWTASFAYHRDISMSMGVIEGMADSYRRFRNTFRYLLGNLDDFDPARDAVAKEEMTAIDRWALSALQGLVATVTDAFESYQFHRAFHALHNFCTVELSSFYFDILKDRLYTAATRGKERRSAQTALHKVLLALVKLSAPILCYTCEEVWSRIPSGKPDVWSVHLADWPEVEEELIDRGLERSWERIIEVRGDVYRAIEQARADKVISGLLEARVEIFTEDEELLTFLSSFPTELETVFIVSEVAPIKGQAPEDALQGVDVPGISVRVSKCRYEKCQRCWNLRESVGSSSRHPNICDKCVGVVEEMEGQEE